MPTSTLKKEKREKGWLNGNSKACNALIAIVRGKSLLKDLHYLKNFGHTGKIDAFNSLCNKYYSNGLLFRFYGMIAPTQLAILDYNVGMGLQQAETKDRKKVVF